MLAERIKTLREQAGMSQEKLAKRLGITRSSVNAWEMGISTPSTQYIAELAGLFRVSADYLLGLSETATVSVAGLTEAEALGATVFHAGTKAENEQVLTAGGRVLGVTALGGTLEEAIERAYAAAKPIAFQDMHFRTDIGKV